MFATSVHHSGVWKPLLLAVNLLIIGLLHSVDSYGLKNYNWDAEGATDDWELADNWRGGALTDLLPGSSNDPGTYAIDGNNYNVNVTASTFGDGTNDCTQTNTYGMSQLGILGTATLNILGDKLTVTSVNGITSPRSGGTLIVNGGCLETNNLTVLDGGSSLLVTNGTVDVNTLLAIGVDPNDPTGNNTFGTPTVTVGTNGILNCPELQFDNEEAETPTLIIQDNGIVNVNGNLLTVNSRSAGSVQITISGTGQLNVTGNLTLTNDWGSNHTITMTGGEINVQGNFDNQGTNSLSGGTITFNGGSSQQVTTGSGASFNNLTLNNGSGLTVNQDISIAGTLNLTAGQLDMSNNTLSLTRASNSPSAISRTSGYIYSESNPITWSINAIGSHTYPFGFDGSNYIPFVLNVTTLGANGNVTLETIGTGADNTPYPYGIANVNRRESPPGVLPVVDVDNSANTVDRFWNITSAASITANITFTARSSEVSGITGLRAQRWTGTTWEEPSANQSGGTVNGVSAFSPWTMSGNNEALPVEFLFFDGDSEDRGIQLFWATATEENNQKFEIERSLDGRNYEKIGEVQGNGDSQVRLDYKFMDEDVPVSVTQDIYYRLKQIDYDGQYDYSEVIRVTKFVEEKTLSIIPNPYQDSFDLTFVGDLNEIVTVDMFDLNGKTYFSRGYDVVKGPNTIRISELAYLPKGMYVIRVRGGVSSFTERIVKR